MPKRTSVDLSHFSFNMGEIGHLQTLASIPVMAGDSISVELEGVWRLSALRRNLVVDCQVDMFAFFVPHRHIYGEDWIQFIKDGNNETITFQGVEISPTEPASYLGVEFNATQLAPLWLVGGYNQIWNRYFRSPNDPLNEHAIDRVPTDADELKSGYKCGYLPQPWSTGVPDGVDATERDVPVVLDTLDIVELNRVQAQYTTEVDREYFGQRYNDLLNTAFGTTVNTDADERPTLCTHNKWWLSGYDVDGTDDGTLGTYSGKSAGIGGLSFKRKFFSEHGALWLMCLPRFPTIHVQERHFLHTHFDPDYKEFTGDPALVAAEPPITAIRGDFFRADTNEDLGQIPYGQWFRYHPNHVHEQYASLDGFPFLDLDINSQQRAFYHIQGEYDEVFQTLQLGHWQSHSRIGVRANRVVPKARTSLYAGA